MRRRAAPRPRLTRGSITTSWCDCSPACPQTPRRARDNFEGLSFTVQPLVNLLSTSPLKPKTRSAMLQRRIRNVWLLLALPVLLLAEFACGPQPGGTARDHSRGPQN